MDTISSHDDFYQMSASDLAAAMQHMPVGVTIIDRQLTVRFWNDVFCRLQGFPDGLMRPGVTMEELFYFIARRGDYGPGDPEQQVRERIELASKFQPHHFTRTRPDGTVLDITGRLIYDAQREMAGFVTIYQDVTVEKRYEGQLEAKNKELTDAYEDLKLAQIGYVELEKDRRKYYQLAVRDSITDLFTRYYMEDAANRLIELHERNQSARLGLLVFDIDHFKDINDTYGHLGGDTVLRQIGRLVSKQSRRVDVPVRLGGDEFAIFLAGVGEVEGVAFAERIRQALTALRFEGDLLELTITVSAGVAEHRIGESLLELIERADTALYEAKRTGRNRVLKAL